MKPFLIVLALKGIHECVRAANESPERLRGHSLPVHDFVQLLRKFDCSPELVQTDNWRWGRRPPKIFERRGMADTNPSRRIRTREQTREIEHWHPRNRSNSPQ